ncbi:hypothetical protein F5148DRAFT_1252226 [Russula earlei]|uniref:Uncharacterized protein n=2 Tax=Russula earlei TaxID=71964 RepID=A0ACC0TR09_9AGAM|nr:hypothetical protein F5148DRAFT_1268729 [Russula earlei]KAI9447212.1 hypothetical protein F5148DRAFT_1252226 [Russula earlei]
MLRCRVRLFLGLFVSSNGRQFVIIECVTNSHLHIQYMPTASEQARPIIIVTGANKQWHRLRFGICRRLLYGFAQTSPDDALPAFPHSGGTNRALNIPAQA